MAAGEREINILKPGLDMVYPGGVQPKADEVSRKLFEATEKAMVQVTSDSGKSGTAFFVGDAGKLITTAHAVLGSTEQHVVGRDGLRYKAQIDAIDDINNIAILSIKGQAPEHTSLTLGNGKNLKGDDRLTAIGIPAEAGSIYTSPGYFKGYRTPAMFLQENHKEVLGSLAKRVSEMPEPDKSEAIAALRRPMIRGEVQIQRGFAGGPLFNEAGEVKGLATMVNPRKGSDSYYTPAEFAQKLLDEKNPKFEIKYEQAPSEWAKQYMDDWRNNKLSAAVETGMAGGAGYLGYRALGRLPNLGGATVGVVGLTMLTSDAQKYLSSTDSADSLKYGLASAADLGTASGAFLSMVPRARGIGLAVMGAGVVGRLATDFIHNRWAMTELKRTDGTDRPPVELEKLISGKK